MYKIKYYRIMIKEKKQDFLLYIIIFLFCISIYMSIYMTDFLKKENDIIVNRFVSKLNIPESDKKTLIKMFDDDEIFYKKIVPFLQGEIILLETKNEKYKRNPEWELR